MGEGGSGPPFLAEIICEQPLKTFLSPSLDPQNLKLSTMNGAGKVSGSANQCLFSLLHYFSARFVTDRMNMIDLVAIVPFYIATLLSGAGTYVLTYKFQLK